MTSTAQMTSSPKKLYIQKKITIFVEDKLTFNNFKQYNMKQGEIEREDDFNERCIQVWNTLCKKADKHNVIQVEEEERDDDNEDCEAEIEEMIEEAVEQVDKENEC